MYKADIGTVVVIFVFLTGVAINFDIFRHAGRIVVSLRDYFADQKKRGL